MKKKSPSTDRAASELFTKLSGNELNFDFPAKTSNQRFRLDSLNHAIGRLESFLATQEQLGLGDAGLNWSAETWTEQYWPGVRRELELIWKSLPKDSREIYPEGVESYFEDFEDFLLELKFRYFESIQYVAHCPMDEDLRQRLGQFALVLKDFSEPKGVSEPPSRGQSLPPPAKPRQPGTKRPGKKVGTEQVPTKKERNRSAIICVLIAHHQATGRSIVSTPLGLREIQRKSGVRSTSTITLFFKRELPKNSDLVGHAQYVRICESESALKRFVDSLLK